MREPCLVTRWPKVIWHSRGTYTIDLDMLADYRKSIAGDERIELEESSILIVVGRSDPDSWEAQVRDATLHTRETERRA